MGSFLNKNIENINYIDFNYKGNLLANSSNIILLENRIFLKESIVSTLLYPLGNEYVPLEGATYLRFKMNWSVIDGTVAIRFYTENFVELLNLGIVSSSTETENINTYITVPHTAKYFRIVRSSNSILTITNLEVYAVTKKEGNSSLLLTSVEALKNVFKMWLFSKKGDYGRKTTLGGPLDAYLGKKLTDNFAQEIDKALRKEINSKFYSLSASDLVVTAIPEEKKFKIVLYLSDNYNKFVVPVAFEIEGE